MAGRKGWLGRVIGDFTRRLRQYDVMMMAAGIAFYWLLAIIPLLLLGSSIVGYVLGSSERGVDEVMAMARRLIPTATGRDVSMFLRSIVESRVVTGVLGIGFLLWVGMGVFDAAIVSVVNHDGNVSYLGHAPPFCPHESQGPQAVLPGPFHGLDAVG